MFLKSKTYTCSKSVHFYLFIFLALLIIVPGEGEITDENKNDELHKIR